MHKTKDAKQLKGGTLALFLSDMMRTMALTVSLSIPFTSSFNITHLNPTRIKRNTEAFVNILVESHIESIDNFSLLNTDGIPG